MCATQDDELANSGVYVHVDADNLIRQNRKRVRFCSEVSERASACAPSNIQDVIARWQFNAIISISVRSHARDFLFPILAQDDERIFSVVLSGNRSWRSVRKLNFPRQNNL